MCQFLSTLSLRRATKPSTFAVTETIISIHALLAESDRLCTILYSCPGNFYPRSPCGERLQWEGMKSLSEVISIHALLAESDPTTKRNNKNNVISIHALLAESDRNAASHSTDRCLFLSTLSLRRATRVPLAESTSESISIHALLAESDRSPWIAGFVVVISIHALLAESDILSVQSTTVLCIFLSTLSLRRATADFVTTGTLNAISIHALLAESDNTIRITQIASVISIHALLAESDVKIMNALSGLKNFYPRSPCGERQFKRWCVRNNVDISIHALLAESDQRTVNIQRPTAISIHALLAESDVLGAVTSPEVIRFLSTLSLRRATTVPDLGKGNIGISIHALLAESDDT